MAVLLVGASGVLAAQPAQAVTQPQTVFVLEQADRDCQAGDLNDCGVSEGYDEATDAGSHEVDDAEQGVAAPITGRLIDYPVRVVERHPAIRCWLTQSSSPECAPYLRGQTLSENLFAEGSEHDDDMPAAFVNGRGRETLCWVDGKGWPCSKVIDRLRADTGLAEVDHSD